MSNTFQDFKTYMDSYIREEEKLSESDREDFITEAVEEFSRFTPDIDVADLTGDGSAVEFDLPSGFDVNFSTIISIEFPVGEQDPVYLKPSEYMVYRTLTENQIRLKEITLGSAETARMTFTRVHVVDEDSSTISDSSWKAVATLATSKAARALATQYANSRDSIRNNLVNNERRADSYSALADKLEKSYYRALGIDPDSLPPAYSTFDIDPEMQFGAGPITHSRR